MSPRSKIVIALLVFASACGDDGDAAPKDGPLKDAGVVDTATGPDAACFENPQTHLEIINACTDAQKIYKQSTPPLQNPDGTLPPLP